MGEKQCHSYYTFSIFMKFDHKMLFASKANLTHICLSLGKAMCSMIPLTRHRTTQILIAS